MESKKIILLSLLIMVVFIYLSGCDRSKNDWKVAERINTVEAYKEFLSNHPKSKFAETAYERIKALETLKLLPGLWEFKGFYVPPGSSGFVTAPFALGPEGEKRMIHYPETIDFQLDGRVTAGAGSGAYNSNGISLKGLKGGLNYSSLQIVSVTKDELILKNPKDDKRAYYTRPE